ncbi:MAG: LPP20 family lipoprotein [Brevinematales bacterium]|nr:LPP20 family lipoprotein [Brevinematales bacterium]
MKPLTWFTIGFLWLFVACGSQPLRADSSITPQKTRQPDWITTPVQDKSFFYAVGYAEGIDVLEKLKDQALADAKAKIANTIFEQAEVDKEIQSYGMISEDSRESLKTQFRQSVRSRSVARLTGVEIVQQYTENVKEDGLSYTRVWVQAKISRASMENERQRILSELARKLAMVDENIRKAEGAVKEGKIREAIEAYQKAIVSATQVEERRDEIAVYAQSATSLLQNIRIRAISIPESIDTDKGGKLIFQVIYLGDQERSVEGIPVSFAIRGNSGQWTRSALSGKNGQVVCEIQNLKNSLSENRMTVVVDMDFPELLSLGDTYKPFYSQLRDAVTRSQLQVSFKSVSLKKQQQTTAVLCLIQNDGNWQTLKALETEMESVILKRGYKIKRVTQRPSSQDLIDLTPSVFSLLKSQGIAQVIVVSVLPSGISYQESVGRFIGAYQVSLQMVDIENNEVLQTENTRITASATKKEDVLQAFVNAAAKQLSSLLE